MVAQKNDDSSGIGSNPISQTNYSRVIAMVAS